MKDIPPASFLRFHFYPILTATVLNSLSPYGSGPGSHASEISPTLYLELCLTIDSLATAGEGVSQGEGPARDCRDPPALPARMLSPPYQRRHWPSFSSVPCKNGVSPLLKECSKSPVSLVRFPNLVVSPQYCYPP